MIRHNLTGTKPWFELCHPDEIMSPALLVYPQRVEENILRMISMAGSVDNLRPHVKTHKMSSIVKLNLKHNVSKFKCSTLAEVEMAAQCGGSDLLLAMQPSGPQISSFFRLQQRYPNSRISVIADHADVIRQISDQAVYNGQIAGVWLDINNGMNRTGVKPGKKAIDLYRLICNLPQIMPRGLHVYDGHIHHPDPAERKRAIEKGFAPVTGMVRTLVRDGLPIPAIVAGGTPTFPVYAVHPEVEASPGTLILWDAGYSEHFPDLDFLHAAVLLTRVVSIPGRNLLCLDLGHKAIAAEMPHPRVRLIGLPPHEFVTHSEEHLVIKLVRADRYRPGDVIYGIPWHICPTVPRYAFAYAVENHNIVGKWKIDARDRQIMS
jgi:D-serine deaminase-like pyridoxal phosphate-dependent protein